MTYRRREFISLMVAMAASPAVFSEPHSQIDRLFSRWADGPGGSVGVVHKGRLVFAKGYGYSDVRSKRRNSPQTNYDLASVSKQFTATAILLAAQDGKLSLEDAVGRHLPGLPSYAGAVRIDQLLGMVSGLPEYDDSAPTDLSSLIATLKSESPSSPPGQRYEYLNMNYALLTFVAQVAHKMPLQQVLQQRIYGPLGMKNTDFLSHPNQKIPNRATGYREESGKAVVHRLDVPGIGDGNCFSNVEDLSRWCIDLLAGSSILDPRYLRRAWTSGRTNNGKKTDYGFGFEVQGDCISHTGSWAGTSTYLGLYPKRKLGVVVLSNWEDESVEELGEKLANKH